MKGIYCVLLVLAKQQRCSETVHGGVAAWLRQRMTAMWQVLQVTKGAAECTQPVSSSTMATLSALHGTAGR